MAERKQQDSNAQQSTNAPSRTQDSGRQDAGTAQVQKQLDAETEQGFRGTEVDTTPNDNYTVSGVTSGAPTPETDEAQADQVRQDAKKVEKRANGVAER